MANLGLWEQWKDWKKNYRWVDLSHELSANTPHWDGFKDLQTETLFDFDTTIFQVQKFTLVSQYGTHVDAPVHFVEGARPLGAIEIDEMVMPLCVMDFVKEAEADCDFMLMPEHIQEWEKTHGTIPEGAFVAFRTDWSKRDDLDNRDESGAKHYPGWSVDAIKWLVENRNIGAIGHEPSDTDVAIHAAPTNYAAEYYILAQDRFQIELLCNLDKVPATGAIIFCTFPKAKDAAGFTARCFALCPKE